MIIRDSLSEQERQIYDLIQTAARKDLITNYAEDGDYISCTLDNIRYEVAIGFDPDPVSHPSAQKAIITSKFVTHLINKINMKYSRYLVQPCDCSPPNAHMMTYLLNDRQRDQLYQNIIVSEDPTQDDTFDTGLFILSYEIELEIVATIGEIQEKMCDFLTVKMNSGELSYTHNHTTSQRELKVLKNITINETEEKNPENQANGILDLVMIGMLPGKKADEYEREKIIQRMLSVLENSENSNFGSFLAKASEHSGKKIEQINVTPRSLLIVSEYDKKYTYHAYSNRDKSTGALSLIWRSSLGEIKDAPSLYLNISTNDEFVGLTNIETDPKHNVDNFNSLVLAHKADTVNGKICVTPDQWTLNESYGHIKNHAVPVNRNGVITYFLNKYATMVDGQWRLALECSKCCLSDSIHYYMDLSNNYYLKNGKIALGLIYTKNVNSFVCDICNKRIYYLSENEKKKYLASRQLLDGMHYCDYCPDKVNRCGRTYKKLSDVCCGDKKGMVYAAIQNDSFLPIDNGGNVFVCANCGKLVLHDTKLENSLCGICNSRICSKCAGNAIGTPHRKVVLNRSTRACKCCAAGNASLSNNKKLFSVTDNNGIEYLVLDDAEEPELIFHCADCGKLKYFDKNKSESGKKCAACGRIICSLCMQKHQTANSYFELTFCRDCAEKFDSQFECEKDLAEKSFHKLSNKKSVIAHNSDQTNAEKHLYRHFKVHFRKYLSCFCAEDRKLLGRLKKEDKIESSIKISCLTVAVLKKTENYKFTVSVSGGNNYLFYLMKNRLVYGGIYNAHKA